MSDDAKFGVGIVVLVAVVLVGCASLFWFIPMYRVWTAGMHGKAVLRQAEAEKQVMVEQARAEMEAAQLRAEAIAIVGKASKEYPEYRTQEFIGAFAEAMQNGKIEKIIYVPTEANIPIVEARSAER